MAQGASIQLKLNKAYAKVANALGYDHDFYRLQTYQKTIGPITFTYVEKPIQGNNWIGNLAFSYSLNDGYSSSQKYGVSLFTGWFDGTEINQGDIIHDTERGTTFFVASMPDNQPIIVIQCFNTITINRPVWQTVVGAGYQAVNTEIALDIPANKQSMGSTSIDRDTVNQTVSDSTAKWTFYCYLPSGTIEINDVIIDDQGNRSLVNNVYFEHMGYKIETTEIV